MKDLVCFCIRYKLISVKLVGVHRLDVKFGKRNAINSAAVSNNEFVLNIIFLLILSNTEEANVVGKLANAIRTKDEAIRLFLSSGIYL